MVIDRRGRSGLRFDDRKRRIANGEGRDVPAADPEKIAVGPIDRVERNSLRKFEESRRSGFLGRIAGKIDRVNDVVAGEPDPANVASRRTFRGAVPDEQIDERRAVFAENFDRKRGRRSLRGFAGFAILRVSRRNVGALG